MMQKRRTDIEIKETTGMAGMVDNSLVK